MIKTCIIVISLCLILLALGFISGRSYNNVYNTLDCLNANDFKGRKGDY